MAIQARYPVRFGPSDQEGGLTFPGAQQITIALRNVPYREIYEHLESHEAFNIQMPDGALIQLMYEFSANDLRRHRLAYFPDPNPGERGSGSDDYEAFDPRMFERLGNIVPFPIRFDFDAALDVHANVAHPKSHMTLGQFERSRIPVSSPLTPSWFIDFILRNFYDSDTECFSDKLPTFRETFEECITNEEQQAIHVRIPS